MSETDKLWDGLTILATALANLAGAMIPLVNDPALLGRLEPFEQNLRDLGKLHAEHCRSERAEAGPSDLHSRVEVLEQHHADREADRARPWHITIKRKEKQNEKA